MVAEENQEQASCLYSVNFQVRFSRTIHKFLVQVRTCASLAALQRCELYSFSTQLAAQQGTAVAPAMVASNLMLALPYR
jgi:hypothetical protein